MKINLQIYIIILKFQQNGLNNSDLGIGYKKNYFVSKILSIQLIFKYFVSNLALFIASTSFNVLNRVAL